MDYIEYGGYRFWASEEAIDDFSAVFVWQYEGSELGLYVCRIEGTESQGGSNVLISQVYRKKPGFVHMGIAAFPLELAPAATLASALIRLGALQ